MVLVAFYDADQTDLHIIAVKLYKAAVQAAVKEALKGNPPKCGSGGKSMTKEQIMAVSNPLERQKLIAENIALFQ